MPFRSSHFPKATALWRRHNMTSKLGTMAFATYCTLWITGVVVTLTLSQCDHSTTKCGQSHTNTKKVYHPPPLQN
jgi:hypothetical protein